VVVLEGVYENFLNRLREATESITIGPADEPATIVGPVIDEDSRKRIREYIEIGRHEGRLLVEAKLPDNCADGYFVAPVIFADVKPDARIAQDEIFGPVLSVLRASDFDEAIEFANSTRYALTGGLFSRSPSHIDRARREFAAGNLYINRKITGSQVDAQPFGGYKFSGTGVKAGSPNYLVNFMDARCITENTARSGFVPDEEHTEVS
jgi:RHH-type proline utilization regulon transcriptional repressor/proline dehydrogenase/delta 1-pyrroline-5-carboxylate dehydrogenase